MSDVTGTLTNGNSFAVIVKAGSVSHGDKPIILQERVAAGATVKIFVANSDGAGVEGAVDVSGNGVEWELKYDNPVAGSNSCSVDDPKGYTGSCDAGGGTDASFTYKIGEDD